ncbi:MAG: glycoside hydrolase family 1 protein [Myxococcales bacterium]|nr:glycoside hydrolase family 1 protein [Myxococcales bacterium]
MSSTTNPIRGPLVTSLAAGLWLSLGACTGKAGEDTASAAPKFPDGFMWGTAVAGFQVDPGCPTVPAEECEDRASDWYQWVTDPELVAETGNHLSGQPLSDGPGHYELYETDLDNAVALGTTAFRTSIEWSRLFPNGAAEGATTVDELMAHVDPSALAYYNAYFDAIVAHDLTPLVTLNHYTLPLWIHDGKGCHDDVDACTDRGWLDLDRMKPAIALYSGFCAQQFGDRVDWWATQNEPFAVVLSGYLMPSEDRTNPPGVSRSDLAIPVAFNLAEGHAAMYDAVKASDEADADGDGIASMVGAVPNLVAVAPLDPENPTDVQGAEDLDYVYNRVYLNATVHGDFDRDLDGVAEEHRDDIAGRMDYIGVNYYTRITVRGLSSPFISAYPKTDFYPEVVWEEYPEGLADVVRIANSYGVPAVVTENGTQPTETAGDDFLRPHLSALLGAMDGGADVRGYFYWTLVDNYEWNHGMSFTFGMYALDPDTKERTERAIGETYTDIITSGVP